MRHHTTSRLSEHMELTPEGYLLCRSVPIARTGALEYLPEEVPEDIAEGASSPTVLVYRNPEDVFAEVTIASYEGKDVTVDHPEDFVTPENWRELTVGHAQNVRQGEGKDADLLLADLLIKDQGAIDLILPPEEGEDGKPQEPLREVSCGYDADYEVIVPGIGKQTNIIGNHIALVPHGRCGSRCAIKDKEPDMATKKQGFWDRVLRSPKVKRAMDEAAAEEKAKDEEPEKKTEPEKEQQTATDSDEKLDELLIMMRSLLDALKPKNADSADPACDDDPAQTGDDDPEQTGEDEPDGEKTKTGDARFRVADAAVISRAGRLAPGMRFRVGDSAAVVKRAALQAAMADNDVAGLVQACLGGTHLSRAVGATLDSAFTAAAAYVRTRNNGRTGAALGGAKARDGKPGSPTTPAQINEQNQKYRDSLQGK